MIEEPIGRGGMGAVFRAVDQRLQRVVAVKVLSPEQSQHHNGIQRFQNEARASARLDHDNIARVYYVGEDHGLHFIVYEFVTGQNVRDLIHSTGRLEPAEAINYTLQIAAALKHTSAAGVVHRDIKPSNIIVTPAGRAKLVDLGLARKEYSESAEELTVAGTTLGTFDYISPEQAKDPRNVDVRSDIYSLGCTLYHMLTGEPPYPDGTFFQRLLDHKDKTPPNPAHLAPKVPPALATVVQKMMASEPRQRYQTADDLIRDLMLIAGSMGLQGLNPEGLVWGTSRLHRRSFWERNLSWIVTAAALLLIVFLLDRFPGIGRQAANTTANREQPADHSGVLNKTGKSRRGDGSDSRIAGSPVPTPGRIETNGKAAVGRNGSGGINHPSPLTTSLIDHLTSIIGSSAACSIMALNESRHPAVVPQQTNVQTPRKTVAANNAENTTGSAGSGKTGTGKSPAQVTTVAAIAVDLGDGSNRRSFPTLEAACAFAKDGNVIVLSFDGTRKDSDGRPVYDKPLRVVNKTITIRAADGFHPQIEFVTATGATESVVTRMISVSNGKIDIINLDLTVHIDENVVLDDGQRWSLLTLYGADRVKLTGVNVTILNPGKKPAAICEISPGTGANLARMKMMKKDGTEPDNSFQIEFIRCFVRGDCDACLIGMNRPGRVVFRQSAVAVKQSLLHVLGDSSGDMPPKNAKFELELLHITCLVGKALLSMDSGELPRTLLPVHVTARYNLIAAKNATTLVSMAGNTDPADFRRNWLRWVVGTSNFYDRFSSLWTMTPGSMNATGSSVGYSEWKNLWGENTIVNMHQGGIPWKQDWTKPAFAELSVNDLRLDPQEDAKKFPAVNLAPDGTPVGVDLSALRDFPTAQAAESGDSP
ncbi:MAG: serine/threonine protein kinase [Planctomycetes bacterium]|nr:serine/threonine protein kinase [Planctomycetota bacterium]